MKTNKFSKMMAFFVITIMLFSNLLCAREIDFNYQTAQEYASSIKRLRELVSHPATNIPFVRFMNLATPESVTVVNYPNSSRDGIKLVIRDADLYVVGFISGDNFFRFNDPEFSEISVPGTTTISLPGRITSSYSGHYNLFRFSSIRSLEAIDIDQNILNSSIRNLYHYGSGSTTIEQVADAMLRLIVFTSEATRFASISGSIAANLNSGTRFRLGTGGAARINGHGSGGWAPVSEFANNIENNPALRADYFDYISSSRLSGFNLFGILAVAQNCNFGPRTLGASAICPPDTESASVLINNTYWPKDILVNILD